MTTKPNRPRPGYVNGRRGPPPAYSGPPPAVTALNGLTLVIPPAPPTRRRGTPAKGLGAGGAYRLRLLSGKAPLPGGGYAYVYAAGPYTVAAPYEPGTPAAPRGYGAYGPALTVYGPGGAVIPPGRGYYLRGAGL